MFNSQLRLAYYPDPRDTRVLKQLQIPSQRLSLSMMAACAVVVGAVGCRRDSQPSVTSTNNVSAAKVSDNTQSKPIPPLGLKLPAGVTESEFGQAEQWLRDNYPGQAVTRDAVLLILADQLAKSGKQAQAIECFRSIPTTLPRLGLTARIEQAKLLIELNQAEEAEAVLREFLDAARVAQQLQPEQVLEAFKWLTFILSVEIRQEDRRVVLQEQHEIGLADPLDSKQLFFPNLLILNSPAGRKRIAAFLEKDPDNLKLQVASARYRSLEGKFAEAIEQLEALRAKHSQDLVVAAALAEAYFEAAEAEKLDRLISDLPAVDSAEPWLLTRMRGEHALEQGNWQAALDCFNRVLETDPANAPAQMGSAKALAQLGDDPKHQQALKRSGLLAEIRVNLSSVQADAQAACLLLAEKCRQIDMIPAAAAFENHAKLIGQQSPPSAQPNSAPK
jgi:thioredoxin-like negative regulator of GroEL